tara:strand:+ start:1673 stop:2815 length:1143 start_codon:yes stop_codon:yes gene_type:complete
MAFYVGSTQQALIPATSAADRGTHVASGGDGSAFWAYLGGTATVGSIDNGQWRYRSIYTHGYIAAGYKGYNPWRSVNKTWHSTDTTFYCGEQIANTQSYTNGVWSDHNAYIVANGGHSAIGSIICSYSLHNGTIRAFSADGFSSTGISYGYVGNDPKNEGLAYGTAGFGSNVGGMGMSVTRLDMPATQDIKGQSGWFNGGGSTATSRIHFATEVNYTGWDSGSDGIGDAASGELRGYFEWAAVYKYVTWSNDTWSGAGSWGGWAKDGHCKIQSTKWGHHYTGTGTNVTAQKSRFSDSTGTNINTYNKVRSYGEDNVEDGQDWGYIMGHYDGQQNNHTIKQTHSTDVEITLGAAAQPKGHFGQSSGACSTGAASITASIAY